MRQREHQFKMNFCLSDGTWRKKYIYFKINLGSQVPVSFNYFNALATIIYILFKPEFSVYKLWKTKRKKNTSKKLFQGAKNQALHIRKGTHRCLQKLKFNKKLLVDKI